MGHNLERFRRMNKIFSQADINDYAQKFVESTTFILYSQRKSNIKKFFFVFVGQGACDCFKE